MKKVLHVISQKPSDTGSGVYIQNLISNGNDNNMNQAIVYGINSGEEIRIEIPNERRYPIEFETDNLPFSVLGMSDVMPYRSSVFSKLEKEQVGLLIKSYRKAIESALLDFQPDIIFCQHLWILTSLTKNIVDEYKLNIPVYGFCHGTDLRQLELSRDHKDLVVDGCGKLDKIFALNDFQINRIHKEYNYDKSNIKVLGNGYNSKYFYRDDLLDSKKIKKRIIYAGKLSYSKGLMSLIKAFKLIDDSNYELYIAGNGHGKEFDEIIKVIEEDENIHYLGKLSQRELGNEFRQADLFVLPSFYEGLPLVIIEAIACGLNVVCTNISGLNKWLSNLTKDSSIISFVDLPKMISVDEPMVDDLLDFEKRLSESMINALNYDQDSFDYNFLKEITWEEIFRKLNKYI